MKDLDELYATTATRTIEMSQADWDREIKRLFQRQQAISKMLNGDLPIDYVQDMLAEHGINPHEWVNAVEENVEHIIRF